MNSIGDWPRARVGQSSEESPDSREPGTRRKKFAGYLKAANELRQTYQQSYRDSWSNRNGQGDGTTDVPGAFPGAISATSGHEQLVIFPSYARRHIKQKPTAIPGTIQESAGSGRDVRDTSGSGDAQFWRQEWDKYEDDNAIVDVDVRGWLYSPHRGPLSRRSRLMVGLARQLSGIPAPRKSPSTSTTTSRSSSPTRLPDRLVVHNMKHEEEEAAQVAEKLIKDGEAKAQVAGRGSYSEDPADRQYDSSKNNTPDHSRQSSLNRARPLHRSEEPYITPVQKQTSWNNPAQLSQAELVEANAQMMSRLQPFLANPLTYTPISAFFYNEKDSRQKTVETDGQGHFTFRAALSFVPTHVRILASDKLSITEEVQVTEPHGVSVISDIDDTIKHSAISMGAREIFRNVFIRDVGELSIKGVKEWYQSLANLGCTFHYVSNSPWQMYPLLTSFFSSAGLPPGSFHLKQYSGVFQGIFEPVAERKKGTLEKILMDFPERRFILVGDSGEADLEVYTDFVCENPGRVLGVFIRDVTTIAKPEFFDPTPGPASNQRPPTSIPDTIEEDRKLSIARYTSSPEHEADLDLKEAIARSLADSKHTTANNNNNNNNNMGKAIDAGESRPALPPRRPTAPAGLEENLIDFGSDVEHSVPKDDSDSSGLQKDRLHAPPRPAKPRSLSGQSINNEVTLSKLPPPPMPRKPSTSIRMRGSHDSLSSRLRRHPTGSDGVSGKPSRPEPPAQRGSYRAAARTKLDSAYAKLPSTTSFGFGSRSRSHSRENSVEIDDLRRDVTLSEHKRRPPIPPRKPLSYTGSAAHSLHNIYTSAIRNRSSDSVNAGYGSDGATGDLGYNSHATSEVPISKKEEAWARRWERAKGILDRKGVVLQSWRVGDDARGTTTDLVEGVQRQEGRRGAEQLGRWT